jgi:hypothetical protein
MGTACQLKCVIEEGSTQSINETGYQPSLHQGAPYDFRSDKKQM